LKSAFSDRRKASDKGFYGLILDNILSESCKYNSLKFYLHYSCLQLWLRMYHIEISVPEPDLSVVYTKLQGRSALEYRIPLTFIIILRRNLYKLR